MFPSPSTSRTLARVPGVSWVLVDQEHGNVSDSAMHECIANVAPYGVSPLVRVPDSERWMIKRALDAGAHGIMVPLLSTVEEVEEVVKQVFCLIDHAADLSSRNFLRLGRGVLGVHSLSMRSIFKISENTCLRQTITPRLSFRLRP